MSLVMLNEKLRMMGSVPEKFVSRNPVNKEGNIKNGMRFKDKGMKTPIILTMLFLTSKFNFFSLKL